MERKEGIPVTGTFDRSPKLIIAPWGGILDQAVWQQPVVQRPSEASQASISSVMEEITKRESDWRAISSTGDEFSATLGETKEAPLIIAVPTDRGTYELVPQEIQELPDLK